VNGIEEKRPGVTERLARVSARHPRRTLALWGVLALGSLVLVATSLTGLTTDANVTGHPESERAADLLSRAFPPTPAELARQVSDVIVVSSANATTDESAFRRTVSRLVGEARSAGTAASVRSYLIDPKVPVSRDRHAALIQVLVGSDDDIKPIVAAVKRADGRGGFQVAITGDHTVGNDFGVQSEQDLRNGEVEFGLPVALVVLVLVFGAIVGGLVPLLLAVLSIVVGLGVVAALSTAVSLSVFIVNMLIGMGLALGIDYSLFVVSRYREERHAGADQHQAIGLAGATASRAVLFSGSTFVVALLGMFLVPTTIMRSLAAGAIIVGVISVAAALTLLPALLGLLGDRVNAGRIPIVSRGLDRPGGGEGAFWRAIVDRVLARPTLSLAVSVALLLAASVPLLDLHIGASGVDSLPSSLPSKQGALALRRFFPAQNPYPAHVLVVGGGDRARTVLVGLSRQLDHDRRFGAPTLRRAAAYDLRVLSVPVRGDANSREAVAAVRELRSRARAALAGTGATVLVGGHTAEQADYYDAVTRPTPYVLVFVLGLSFVLLTIAFRSIAVAGVSLLLNLLSVGAAYGLLTLVFLKGVGAGFLGFEQVDVVDAWVPLFLFSVLFGLSMDYQVFLMSRIKERFDAGAPTREAVASGVATTARLITGAALIIVAVFSGFAKGELVMFQQMGFGVAVALLIDATVIRSVVLPSMLALLGRRSWYLPRWLEWLPRVEVESPAAAAAPQR
jgi:putative drug exporter of the RND superfamily